MGDSAAEGGPSSLREIAGSATCHGLGGASSWMDRLGQEDAKRPLLRRRRRRSHVRVQAFFEKR
jgi:hypothetical protein